jgi:hypothetical protein
MVRVEWSGAELAKAAIQAAIEVAKNDAEVIKGEAVDLAPLGPGYDPSNAAFFAGDPKAHLKKVPAGQLRNSATVNEIENGAEISFNTPYAHRWHESEGWVPSHEGTGPNYLRQPLLDKEQDYYDHVAAAVKAVFG